MLIFHTWALLSEAGFMPDSHPHPTSYCLHCHLLHIGARPLAPPSHILPRKGPWRFSLPQAFHPCCQAENIWTFQDLLNETSFSQTLQTKVPIRCLFIQQPTLFFEHFLCAKQWHGSLRNYFTFLCLDSLISKQGLTESPFPTYGV